MLIRPEFSDIQELKNDDDFEPSEEKEEEENLLFAVNNT